MASIQTLGLLVQNQVSWRWLGSPWWAFHPPGGTCTSRHKSLERLALTSAPPPPRENPFISHMSKELWISQPPFTGVCVCVCVCTCVNKENTLSSPGALSWPLPLPLLSLNKRLIPGRLCPLLHSEPCRPIYHCVPFTLHRDIIMSSRVAMFFLFLFILYLPFHTFGAGESLGA